MESRTERGTWRMWISDQEIEDCSFKISWNDKNGERIVSEDV